MESINLAKALRALRRAADLSQRELAHRAGVPRSTVGRIEAGEITNPTFQTIEALATAAGGHVTISVSQEPLGDSGAAELLAMARSHAPDDVPHEDRTDGAGRHYPAHLDVRATYPILSEGGVPLPAGTRVDTYELNRLGRDLTRTRRAPAMSVHVSPRELSAGEAWDWTATAENGTHVAWLGAQHWQELPGLICQLRVVPGWEATGADELLVTELRAWLDKNGPIDVFTFASDQNALRLRNLGFYGARGSPQLLRLSTA